MKKGECTMVTIKKGMKYLLWFGMSLLWADNPIVQTYFTPDPAVMVHEDVLYVYTGHDEDVIENNFFTMYNYRVYSTTDMVNWTDHGSPLSYRAFDWAGNKAWAAQAIYRNGKFYWYVTVGLKGSNQPAIGVAVSDSPTGPFVDALGKPLISQSWDDIDPTVFIDDDGQAYLYWGNPQLYYVTLNEDMISYSGAINRVPMTTQSFGERAGDAERATTYEEGPYMYKRGGVYYMLFAAGPLPETIGYATATSPVGPWNYQGKVMSQTNTGSFTNHPAIVEYKGKGYFFYHTGKLPDGGGYHRSTAVESFDFAENGLIPELRMSESGPTAIATVNPYNKVQAETMAWSQGLKVGESAEVGVYVTAIDNDDFLVVRNVDFTQGGASRFLVHYSAAQSNGSIEVRTGSQTGTLVGVLPIQNTGINTAWKLDSIEVDNAMGVQDIYLVFKGGGYSIDYWQFRSAVAYPESRDSIFNGHFDQASIGWTLNVWEGLANGGVVEGEYCIAIQSLGTVNHQIQLIQSGILLEQHSSYLVSFEAYSALPRDLEVNVEMHTDPWTSYVNELQFFNITAERKGYEFLFVMNHPTDSMGRLSFNVGSSLESICLDNVAIVKTETPTKLKSNQKHAWQREGVPIPIPIVQEGRVIRIPQELGEMVQSVNVYNVHGRAVSTFFGVNAQNQYSIRIDAQRGGTFILHIQLKSGREFFSKIILPAGVQ
jgi:arabinoxylan arabinofuranohydrolase